MIGDPVPGLDVTGKDVESDEAIWNLYKNWCKAWNKERDHDDMNRRFHIFKKTANFIHRWKHRRMQLGFSLMA